MTKKEIVAIIDAEIKWCKETPMNMPEDFRQGFVEGLRQAKSLIRKTPVTK